MSLFSPPGRLPQPSRKIAFFLVSIFSLAAAACIYLSLDRISEDIAVMLPDNDPKVARDLDFFRGSPWADKVFILLEAGPNTGEQRLQNAAGAFANQLPGEYFPRVLGLNRSDQTVVFRYFLERLPLLLGPDALSELEDEFNYEAVRKRMRENRALAGGSQGIFFKDAVRLDPLNLRRFFLSGLKNLRGLAALDPKEGFTLSKNGQDALITAACSVDPTDSKKSREMLDALDKVQANLLPPDIECTVVSAHAYSEANARIIRSDMNIVLGLSAAGLFLVFGLFLRRPRSLWILLIPALSLLWAAAAYCLVFPVLSGIVLGFGAVLLGLTLDFGVHVYAAAETSGEGENPARKVFAPLMASGLTTCSGFLVLSLSGISGIRQLSFLAVCGIAAACFLALFVLPGLVQKNRSGPAFLARFSPPGRGKRPIVFWSLFLLFLACASPFISFSGDLKNVGYFPDRLRGAEERIKEIAGPARDGTMIVAAGADVQKSLRLNDLLYRELQSQGVSREFVSSSPLLPAKKTQGENLETWHEFWTPKKKEQLREWLTRAGKEFGFRPEAFTPFVRLTDQRTKPEAITPEGLSRIGLPGLAEVFIGSNDAVYTYSAGRDQEAAAALSSTAEDLPGVHVLSEAGIGRRLGQSVKKDLLLYAGLGFAVIAAFLLLVFRRPLDIFLAFLPPASAVLALTGLFALFSVPLNLFHAAGVPLAIGLGVDYGIFMLFWERSRDKSGTPGAVFISGLSTMLAFGALALAGHPALSSLGISVLIGVGAASICALFVLPFRKNTNNNPQKPTEQRRLK